ncbi:14833_t:CDS:2 [Funneliformis geosporum]|nr:14833_t:CDS:2 [Funneliformis geosporum]
MTNKNSKQKNKQREQLVITMEVDPLPSKKCKEKETLEETPENTTTTLDVNTNDICKIQNDHSFHNENKEYEATSHYHQIEKMVDVTA